MIALVVCLNPFSISQMSAAGILGGYFGHETFGYQQLWLFSMFLSTWLIGSILSTIVKKQSWSEMFQSSALYNGFSFVMAFGGMLAANPIHAGRLQWLRLVLPLLVLYLLGRTFWLAVIKREQLASWKRNLATVLFVSIALLLVLEGVFMFVARSHQFDGTLASKVWFARHWELNSQGSRDVEMEAPKPGPKKLFLMGDSFVAGHGIKDTEKRFGNLIQAEFEDDFKIYNLGANGFGTRDELLKLQLSPIKPDHVILFWYLNDIEECAWKNNEYQALSNHRYSLLDGSYLFNYIWWSYPHPTEGDNYLQFLEKAFANENVISCHIEELNAFTDYCKANKIEFTLAAFPFMQEPKQKPFAQALLQRFLALQAAKNNFVTYLDLSYVFANIQPDTKLVVNDFDSHPNELANQFVADQLEKYLHSLVRK